MTEDAPPAGANAAERILRHFAACLLSPISAYFLGYIGLNIVDLCHGRAWHLFLPWYGIGLGFVCMQHQWATSTIVTFYILCSTIALPVLALVRRRTKRHLFMGTVFAWCLASAAYFFLLCYPYSYNRLGVIYGAVAGATAGVIYYIVAYAPSARNA